MSYKGVLLKMRTEFSSPIQYFLNLENNIILMNDLIDKEIHLKLEGYQCLCCNKKKKIYRQGNCYDCFYDQASMGDWIMKPELSTAHLGIEDRDIDYEKSVQLTPHIVYLALSSDVKVGVTRKTQVPTRWIDQGANEALAILEVPNRYLAGISEVALKEFVADKTNWRKMLKNDVPEVDLRAVRDELEQYIPVEAKEYFIKGDAKPTKMEFPVLQYPEKVKSLNLEKTPEYSGKLKGIKGQYLIFEDNTVFNIRSNEGTVVSLSI
jgi:hypothetical protein